MIFSLDARVSRQNAHFILNFVMGSKERHLLEKYEEVEEELKITHIIRHLRTTEGLLRDKLSIDNESWEQAMYKYSVFKTKS